ncbi:MAG: type II TA system antitoxin MqsA family protein [Candidatus Solibacter sp.]
MKCFQCQKGKMIPAIAGMTARVRGEEIPVKTEAMVCKHCGFTVMTDAQSHAYTIASADAYREKHGLLTNRELKEVRNRLKISQQALANFLKVGVASWKRWEAGLIQDEAMDELIRLKTDLPTARENVLQLEAQLWSSNSSLPSGR